MESREAYQQLLDEVEQLCQTAALFDGGCELKSWLASQELNRQILASLPGGVVYVDAQGAVLRANAEAQRILCLSYDELTRKYVHEFEGQTFREDGSPCPVADYPVSRCLATGQPQPQSTIGIQHPDGKIYWALFTAMPLCDPITHELKGAIVTFIDITQRKRIEDELREERDKVQAMMQTNAAAFFLLDLKGQIVFANQWAEEILGVPCSEITRRAFDDPLWKVNDLHGDSADDAELPFRRVLATGQAIYDVSLAVELPNGDRKTLLVNGAPLRNPAGEMSGVVIAAHDVTEGLQVEERIRRLSHELAHAWRLSTAGEMAAELAHELSQPLFAISNFSAACLREVDTHHGQASEEVVQWLKQISQQSARAGKIIRSLSHFVRKAEPDLSLVDLNDLVRDVAELVSIDPLLHRVKIQMELADLLPSILADRILIQQVVVNLIRNGFDAMEEIAPRLRQLHVRTRVEGTAEVMLEVEDTGKGISAEEMDRIFQPYFTTKPQGLGMGLTISRSIVEAHDGRLWASINPYRGMTFHLRLPVAPESSAFVGR